MEGTSLYLPIVILLMQCSPAVPVTVSTSRHKVEVREFTDAVLSCMFHTERDQNPRIEWKKKGKDVSFVYFDGHFRGPFEGRATIDGATVTLQRVTQEDAGEYRCEISAPLDSVSLGETNVTLKVLVPPHIPSCEIPSSAVTGSVVHLRCRDQQSIPPATYSWFKNNMPISQPRHANASYLINSLTGVLEFKAVGKEDTGQYSCLASNGVGTPKMCEGKHMTIGLADFGLSNHFQRGTLLQTYCGSPLYAAPEIVKGLPYQGPEVDCWALGVLLYALVYSSMPFDGASHTMLTEQISQGRYHRPKPPSDACALIDWLLTVRVDERATIEDVANHWWVNWGYEESVCDCPSSPQQECPSPLLARYIDWQNRVAAASNMTVDSGCQSSDSLCPTQRSHHPFYLSLPLKSDRGGGRTRGGMSSLRKSRKENAIPQTGHGACGGACATATSSTVISSSTSTTSAIERKKPKGILKPQRSFDSVFHSSPKENSSSQLYNASSQPYRTLALNHTHAEVLSTSLPSPSTFSQPSSKMPKKGILKNLYGGESSYGSCSDRRGSGAGVKESEAEDLCSYIQHSCVSAAEDSPTMRTEAVRRRKGILKRNGKFSRSLDLPDDHQASLSSVPTIFPEALQQLLHTTRAIEGQRSRPSSVVSEDSLFSSDSFDLLDLSAQSRRRIFSQETQHSTCSSEEDLERLRAEGDRVDEHREGQKEMLT